MAGTYMIDVFYQWLDDNGDPLAGGSLEFFVAGTTTPQDTFVNVDLTTPNQNPLPLDSAGRSPGPIFLKAASYKVIWRNSFGAVVLTRDNLQAVSSLNAGVDIQGVAGQLLLIGDCCYLSDGSGGLIAGRYYRASAVFPYSSTLPTIAFANEILSTGQTGSLRLDGLVANPQGVPLILGEDYYVALNDGEITATAPVNKRRVGQAQSVTELVVTANPPVNVPVDTGLCDGRLSLDAVEPVPVTDQLAKTIVWVKPYLGDHIALYDGTRWHQKRLFGGDSLALTGFAANTNFDIFIALFGNPLSDSLVVEAVAWSNNVLRATPLVVQDGVYVKSGQPTRRYLGTIRTTAVVGQCEDSMARRFVWNYYNRVNRPMRVVDPADSWTYTNATLRQVNANVANQLDLVVGVAEDAIWITALHMARNSTNIGIQAFTGIGLDSTTTNVAGMIGGALTAAVTNVATACQAQVTMIPSSGRHFFAWLEASVATGTWTFIGDNGAPTFEQTGIHAMWRA